MNYTIDMNWDSHAAVWIATSDDVPGLVMESGSFDGLVERVKYAVPELLELNQCGQNQLDLTIVSKRQERIVVNG